MVGLKIPPLNLKLVNNSSETAEFNSSGNASQLSRESNSKISGSVSPLTDASSSWRLWDGAESDSNSGNHSDNDYLIGKNGCDIGISLADQEGCGLKYDKKPNIVANCFRTVLGVVKKPLPIITVAIGITAVVFFKK